MERVGHFPLEKLYRHRKRSSKCGGVDQDISETHFSHRLISKKSISIWERNQSLQCHHIPIFFISFLHPRRVKSHFCTAAVDGPLLSVQNKSYEVNYVVVELRRLRIFFITKASDIKRRPVAADGRQRWKWWTVGPSGAAASGKIREKDTMTSPKIMKLNAII